MKFPDRISPSSLGLPLKAWFLAASIFLVSFALGACHLDSKPGPVYMDVVLDASWITPDSVYLVVEDAQGVLIDTIYQGIPSSPGDFKGLKVEGYRGQAARILITQRHDGVPVRKEGRTFDGVKATDRDTLIRPRIPGPQTLELRPGALTVYMGGEKAALAAFPAEDWQGQTLDWATTDQSVAAVSPAGEVTALKPGIAYVTARRGLLLDSSEITVALDPPVLDAGAPDTSVLTGSEPRFRVLVSQAYGTLAAFKWDTDGDGAYEDSITRFSSGTGWFSTTPRKFAEAGELTLRFYVRDGEGNVDTASKRVRINSKIPALKSISPETTLTIKDFLKFSAQAEVTAGTLAAYAWDYDGDGKADESEKLTGSNATVLGVHQYNDSGVFTASLRVANDEGASVTGQVKVTVKQDAPISVAGEDTTVDVSTQVHLRGVARDGLGRIVKQEWKIGTAAYLEVSDGDTVFTAGAVAVKLPCLFRVTDDDGLTAVDSMSVKVVLKSAPLITWPSRDTVISLNDTLPFSAAIAARGADLKAYAWDFDGDGKPDSSGALAGRTATLSLRRAFPSEGAYAYSLTVTDADNLTSASQEKFTVKRDTPSADAGADTSVMVEDTVNLRGTAKDSLGVIVKTEWKIGSGEYAPAANGIAALTAPALPGKVTCLFRVTDDDGLTAEDTLLLDVKPSNVATLKALAHSKAAEITPAFTPAVLAYSSEAEFLGKLTRVVATAEHAYATIRIGFKGEALTAVASGMPSAYLPLSVGRNKPIAIEVTAQDKLTVKTYSLTLYRAADTANVTAQVIHLNSAPPSFRSFFNPGGPQPTVNPIATGRYFVLFPGLAAKGAAGGNIQVSSYGQDTTYCKVNSSEVASGNLGVYVDCYRFNGVPRNSGFSLLVQYPRAASTGTNAHLYMDAPLPPAGYIPPLTHSFNSANRAISVVRVGIGVYNVVIGGGMPSATHAGNIMVTAVGKTPERCHAGSLAVAGGNLLATVRCFTAAGAGADAAFNLSTQGPFARAGITGAHGSAYGLYNPALPDSANIVRSQAHVAGSPSTQMMAVEVGGVSKFRMRVGLPGMLPLVGVMDANLLVSAYGTSSNFCGAYELHRQTFDIRVNCWNASGVSVKSDFNFLVTK